jgi:MFS family permease
MRFLRPAWATTDNPVFRYETGRWRHSRRWRNLRPAVWGLALFFFLIFACLPAACVGGLALWPKLPNPASSGPDASIFWAGTLFVLASVVLTGLANGLLGVVSTALAATLIARERESQAWPLVRLTTLTSGQIVGGKLAAFLCTLQEYMHLIVVWRGLTLVGGVLAFVLLTLVSPDVRSLLIAWPVAPAASTLTLAEWGAVGVLIGIFWLVEPYFNVFYNGAVGLAVSTFARTRRSAIVLVFIAQFTLGLALFWPVQQVAAFVPVLLETFFMATFPKMSFDPAQLMVPILGLQWGAVAALQVVVLVSSLALAMYRVERLSE